MTVAGLERFAARRVPVHGTSIPVSAGGPDVMR